MFFKMAALLLFTTSLYAQKAPQIRTGRPGQSIGGNVVGTNVFQVQSGLEYNRLDNNTETKSWINNNVLRYGLNEKWELSTVFDLKDQTVTGSGVDNIQLGGRVNLIAEADGWIPAICFQARIRLKGTGDFERQDTRPVSILATVHNLGDYGSLTTNHVYSYDASNSDPFYSFTVAWGIPINERWGAFIEEYGSYQNDEWSTAIDTGFSYLWHKDLQYDIAFGVDTESNFHQEYVAIGLSWRTL